MYVILLYGTKYSKILWLCFPCIFFSGQKLDAISIVVLILGVRVVMFYSEGAEDSATDPLSWLSCSISYKLLAFGITHGVKAAFHRGLLYISPETPLPSELWLEWNIDNNTNTFQYVMIANDNFQSVHWTPPPPPHLPTSLLLPYSEEWSVMIANDWFRSVPQTVTA